MLASVTYAFLLAASSIVPSNRSVASSAGFGHGVVVVEIYTISFIYETILSIGSGQVLNNSLRVGQRFVYVLE